MGAGCSQTSLVPPMCSHLRTALIPHGKLDFVAAGLVCESEVHAAQRQDVESGDTLIAAISTTLTKSGVGAPSYSYHGRYVLQQSTLSELLSSRMEAMNLETLEDDLADFRESLTVHGGRAQITDLGDKSSGDLQSLVGSLSALSFTNEFYKRGYSRWIPGQTARPPSTCGDRAVPLSLWRFRLSS
jgi:hypothetical protein